MNIFRIIIELFFLYLLYKLIFGFIIPVYNTTKQVKQKVGEMQHQMNEQMKAQQQRQTNNTTGKQPASKATGVDYIDFEEIK